MAKKLTNKQISTLIVAGIILSIGVLFCFHEALSGIISYIIGASISLVGLVMIIMTAVSERNLFNQEGIFGTFIIALGIFFAINDFIRNIFDFIPYFLVGAGALLIGDSFFKLFEDRKTAAFIFELLAGIAILVVGILLFTLYNFKKYTYMVLGIAMIVFALYILIVRFIVKKNQ